MPQNDDDISNLDELAVCKALTEVMQSIDTAQKHKKALLQKLWDLTNLGGTASGDDRSADEAFAGNARAKSGKGIEASNEDIDRLAEEYIRKVQVCGMPSILAYIKDAGYVLTNVSRPGNRVAAVMRNSRKYVYDPKNETWSLRKNEEKVFKMRA